MAFGVVANWGEEGKTVIKICDFEEFSLKKNKLYDTFENVIENPNTVL